MSARLTWEERQLRDACIRVSCRYGPAGLSLLAPEVRDALVKAEVLAVIAANDKFIDNPLVRLASSTINALALRQQS